MFGSAALPRDLDEKMKETVKLKVFTTLAANGYRQCPACENTVNIIKELTQASNKIKFEEISIIEDRDSAEHYNVTRAPTIIIQGHGIRYTGAPIGQETAPFIYTIIMASNKTSIFGGAIASKLAAFRKARLELIVTPTCPYCAQAALIENSMVMESSGKLTVNIIEAYENPDIARTYNVTGVPVTIIDGDPEKKIVGVPSLAILESLLT